MSARAQHRADDGFTIIELIMAIALTAILTATVASAMVVGLRTSDDTSDRLSESVDTQFLATYLPPDVQSSTSENLTAAAQPTCSATVPGDNVLRLDWSETVTSTKTFSVSYRLVTVGTERRLVRYYCVNGGAPLSIVVGHRLASTAAAAVGFSVASSTTHRVGIRLTLATGYTAEVAGVRRTRTGTVVPPPPPPPATCTLVSGNVSPASALRTPGGVLLTAPSVTVTTSGTCSGLTVRYVKSGTTTTSTAMTGSGTWSATLESTGWSEGTRDLTVQDSTGQSSTIPFDVATLTDCVVSTLVASPTAGTRSRNPSPNVLSEGAVTVTATADAACSALVLRYTAATTVTTVDMTKGTGNDWVASIPATVNWSDGSKTLEVYNGTAASIGTLAKSTSFTVTKKACSVLSIVVSPSTVDRSGNKANRVNQIPTNVDVTVTTGGVCDAGAVTVVFTPDATAITLTATEASVGSGTWSAQIAKNTYQWTAGAHTVDARIDNATAASTTLTVNP